MLYSLFYKKRGITLLASFASDDIILMSLEGLGFQILKMTSFHEYQIIYEFQIIYELEKKRTRVKKDER